MILAAKVFFTACILSFIFFPYFIKILRKISKDGQPIRSNGPKNHLITKKNTPTMGGIVILISVLLSTLLWVQLTPKILLMIFVATSFSLIGFIDDCLKLKGKSYKGLNGKVKIIMQFIIAVISMFILKVYSSDDFTKVHLFKDVIIDLGYLYIPFATFIIVGTSNAVNLTDGLDGLAATQIITSFTFLNIAAYLTHADVNVILPSIAFIGATLSFLKFNINPAKIFMGDTGSLGLGAALGLTSILVKREVLLAMIGIIFVIETLSVIIQVSYFKYTKFKYKEGKRIFLMSPIHHHFEKKGWTENTIVLRFWIVSLVSSIIGVAFL